jgi:hypothetical protein
MLSNNQSIISYIQTDQVIMETAKNKIEKKQHNYYMYIYLLYMLTASVV